MNTIRKLLCLLLVMTISFSSAAMIKVSASTTTHYIPETHIRAGHCIYWYPGSSPNGCTMVNGGTDSIKIDLTTRGNKIDAGFRKSATGSLYPWYSGTLTNRTSTGLVTKTLTSETAKYQAYTKNRNETVEIIVLNTSYSRIED